MEEERQKPKVQGNWTCSYCGSEISELPFEPDGDRPISCSNCWRERRQQMKGPSRMVQGNWTCAECGNTITELPFNPAPDQQVSCRDCWRKKQS